VHEDQRGGDDADVVAVEEATESGDEGNSPEKPALRTPNRTSRRRS
jgi:hypothetical protein